MIHSRACDGGVGTRARARGDETCGDDDAIDDDGSSRGALDRARATRGGVAVASASASVAASSLASTSSSRDDARDDSRETNGRKRYAARKIVRGMTREALCDVVADVDSYASFVPFCASAAVTPRETWDVARERDAMTRGRNILRRI